VAAWAAESKATPGHAVALIEPLGRAVGGERDPHSSGEEAFEEAAQEHRIHHVGHL
jgi:hypothetical protein